MSFFTVVHDGQLIGLSSLAGRYISTRIDGKGVFCRQDDPYSYEAEGENYFDMKRQRLIDDGHLVAFGDGDAVTVSAEAEAVRFLLVSGKPIGGPIAWYGPIVMNTQKELRVAFEELDRGTFIKDRSGAR